MTVRMGRHGAASGKEGRRSPAGCEMIGPVGASQPTPETVRQVSSREEAAVSDATTDEAKTRSASAVEEAQSNRSAIVEQAEALLSELRTAAQDGKSQLRIEEDQETEKFIYKSIDRETGEVLNQWPSEDVLRMAKFLRQLQGTIVDETL